MVCAPSVRLAAASADTGSVANAAATAPTPATTLRRYMIGNPDESAFLIGMTDSPRAHVPEGHLGFFPTYGYRTLESRGHIKV
jgi:hypothetical protein